MSAEIQLSFFNSEIVTDITKNCKYTNGDLRFKIKDFPAR
jgi:hypothetical protein